MAVKIGSAHIDERGKAKGGQAGDQTGNELGLQNWYLHSKGWIVLRPKDREVGRKIAWDMEAACKNRHIGYDQAQRNTLYNLAKAVGFDCSKVTEDCETDCSALVRVCINYAGIPVGNFTTSNEPTVLVNTGAFTKLTAKKYTTSPDYLRAGDILVTSTAGHTVAVINDGPKADEDDPGDEPSPANPTDPYGTRYAVTVGNYWLHSAPDTRLKTRLFVVPNNTAVRVYGEKDGMYGVQIQATREKGYISGKALPALGR